MGEKDDPGEFLVATSIFVTVIAHQLCQFHAVQPGTVGFPIAVDMVFRQSQQSFDPGQVCFQIVCMDKEPVLPEFLTIHGIPGLAGYVVPQLPEPGDHIFPFRPGQIPDIGDIRRRAVRLYPVKQGQKSLLCLPDVGGSIFRGIFQAGIHVISGNSPNQLPKLLKIRKFRLHQCTQLIFDLGDHQIPEEAVAFPVLLFIFLPIGPEQFPAAQPQGIDHMVEPHSKSPPFSDYSTAFRPCKSPFPLLQ